MALQTRLSSVLVANEDEVGDFENPNTLSKDSTNVGNFHLNNINKAPASVFSFVPKQDFSGFWGGVKYIWTGGHIDGLSYDEDGDAIGYAPIMGTAPIPSGKFDPKEALKSLNTLRHIFRNAPGHVNPSTIFLHLRYSFHVIK